MATTNSESNHSRTEARERYHRVLRLVDYQSSGPQPPLVSERVIVMLAARAGHDPDDIRSSLQAAVESDDLLRTTRQERTHYARTDEETLEAVVLEAADRDEPDQDLIGQCYTLMADP